MSAPEHATNWYLTRRHLSMDLHAARSGAGRSGTALCSSAANPVEVMDQDQANYWSQEYARKDAKAIDSLPDCKRCLSRVSTSPRAVRVKLADIEDNTDPDRMARLDEATRVRLIEKYRKAREALGAEVQA